MNASFGWSRIVRLTLNFGSLALLIGTTPFLQAQSQEEPVPDVVEPSPTPPPRQYISPFSGLPLPAYSYTNRNAQAAPFSQSRSLTVDPFSRTPLPTATNPPPPVPAETILEVISPSILEMPPGASLQRVTRAAAVIHATATPPADVPRASVPARRPVEYPGADRYEFPPGATLRRK